MKTLDLLHFPLQGRALIEASAGTGKTYTLAYLYLRYLLERELMPDQILVVTFTEAATQELRDRIRSAIRQLIVAFEAGANGLEDEIGDALLATLYQRSEQPTADFLRLKLAERQMDQAEIHTIHGFCQRLLQSQAMTLGVPMQQTLEQDLRPLGLQCVEDFWRVELSRYSEAEQAFVLAQWPEPASLYAALSGLLSRKPDHLLPQHAKGWQDALQQKHKWLAELQAKTLEHADAVGELLQHSDLKALKQKQTWFAQLLAWAQTGASDALPVRSNKQVLFYDFMPEALVAHTKKQGVTPEHAYFYFLESHFEQALPDASALFFAYFYSWFNERMQQEKQQRQMLGFDDLIAQVDHAVQHLACTAPADLQRLRGAYRVALIDEFQDTDQAQYRIFNTLFDASSTPNNDARLDAEMVLPQLVMIGDPKQAIYSFRGGDIATYLRAREDVIAAPGGQLFTMGINWRSSPEMVAAVNHLFALKTAPFLHAQIPFVAVSAAKQPASNAPGPALQIANVRAEKASREEWTAALTQIAVQQVASLLGEYASNDIALLVRTSREAETIKDALAASGIRASFEGQQNIFESDEAISLARLLRAVLESGDDRAIKACLADEIFGLSDAEFRRLNEDAHVHAHWLDTFAQLNDVWLQRGVLAMLRKAFLILLADRGQGIDLPLQQWERRLSNLNQLGEILQQQSTVLPGKSALLQYLYQQIHKPGAADDVRRMRLESDDSLVKIITIHRSKGLEYPVVILPFMFSGRAASEAWYYDDQGALCLDLAASEQALAQADSERLAEDLRLLYVALTRASERCLVGMAPYLGRNSTLSWWQTALGNLLLDEHMPTSMREGHEAYLHDRLQQVAEASGGKIAYISVELSDVANLKWPHSLRRAGAEEGSYEQTDQSGPAGVMKSRQHADEALRQWQARQLSALWSERWRVNSFSAMHSAHQHGSAVHKVKQVSDEASPDAQAVPADAVKPDDASMSGLSIHDFPKGAAAGTFLHQLFEAIALDSGQLNEATQRHYSGLADFIGEQLQRYRLVPEPLMTEWRDFLVQWLERVRRAPLWDDFSLSQLSERDYLVEMSFDFAVNDWPLETFNRLWQRHVDVHQTWHFGDFEGVMTGAIDLLFRVQGRYYILDYKSNYLGSSAAAYHAEALHEAMTGHAYQLQYVIYCLAVHRHLKQRLGERYDYDQHMGGALYLFLRGLADDASSEKGVYFSRPERAFIEALDAMVSGTMPKGNETSGRELSCD